MSTQGAGAPLEFPRQSRYVVTVPMAMVKTLTGGYVILHEGDHVPPGIDPAQREHLLRGEMIALREDGAMS